MALEKLPFLSATIQGYNAGNIEKSSKGHYQANAWQNQGVPNTTPQLFGFLTTENMEKAAKLAEIKPVETSIINGINNQNEMTYVTRPQNESRELENSDISGSHLGARLDLQGCENKAWGKDLEWV